MKLSLLTALFSAVQSWIDSDGNADIAPRSTGHRMVSKPTMHYLDKIRREWDIQGCGISVVKSTEEEHRTQIMLFGRANDKDPVTEDVSCSGSAELTTDPLRDCVKQQGIRRSQSKPPDRARKEAPFRSEAGLGHEDRRHPW